MSLCIIEPRDTLLVRDARPFGAGARAISLDFPFPSTLAGAVRTRLGLDTTGAFQAERVPELLRHPVRGPFLVEVNEGHDVGEFYFPSPHDAVLFEGEGSQIAVRRQVRPLQIPEGACSDLNGVGLVGLSPPEKRKPLRDGPRFWRWSHFKSWLSEPKDGQSVSPPELGCLGPARETRMHVTISPTSGTADEGKLFQTEGLRFGICEEGRLSRALRLGLAVETERATTLAGVSGFGGERRLSAWRPVKAELPTLPDAIAQAIEKQRALRLILVTPAFFEAGWKPGAFLRGELGLPCELAGAIVGRPEVVAGWDLALGRAKPSRRLAAAGSVYFLRLAGDIPAASLRPALEALWLRSVSDTEQARHDGFGIAVLGSWDGRLATLEGGN